VIFEPLDFIALLRNMKNQVFIVFFALCQVARAAELPCEYSPAINVAACVANYECARATLNESLKDAAEEVSDGLISPDDYATTVKNVNEILESNLELCMEFVKLTPEEKRRVFKSPLFSPDPNEKRDKRNVFHGRIKA